MGYVDKYLLDGEHVTYRSKMHWVVYLMPIVLFIVSVAVCVLGVSLQTEAIKYVGYALMIASFLWMCYRWAIAQSCEFAVTNRRIIMKTGVFNRKITELQLHKAEALHYESGFWGGMMGYGTIAVSTGDDKNVYEMISNPEKFRFEINKQIEANRTVTPQQQQTTAQSAAQQQQ